jgi:mono/diheme cytochrome c family protein
MRRRGALGVMWMSVLLAGGCAKAEPHASGAAREPVDGGRLFQRRCASCHGALGNGGNSMNGPAADLTDPVLHDRLTDGAIHEVIWRGKGRMPAVSGMREDEMRAVTAHIRTLRRAQ